MTMTSTEKPKKKRNRDSLREEFRAKYGFQYRRLELWVEHETGNWIVSAMRGKENVMFWAIRHPHYGFWIIEEITADY